MDRIYCIVGPTASGKTGLSVALARRLDGEIISCDSMQLYRGMDIGTAKPTVEERGGIVHHMIDVIEPWEDYSVGRYVTDGDACLQQVLSRGKAAIIVGGTGLYADSLIAGREFAPFPRSGVREQLYETAAQQGIGVIYERLRRVDPRAAEAIHPANEKRVIRALEVYLETGRTFTEHNEESRQKPPKYDPIWIGLDYENRDALYGRIDRRVEEMFRQGLVEEVRRLLEGGVPREATAMQAIGYKELCGYLQGQGSIEEAKAQICLGTRHYAKRQRTWFRRNGKIRWLMLPDEPDMAAVEQQALTLLNPQP